MWLTHSAIGSDVSRPMTDLRLNPARDLTAVAVISAALLTWRWFQFARCLRVGSELARLATAYERHVTGEATRVLIIGDSIAVGCGASRPEESIAGLLAQDFPCVAIVNRARNGARTAEATAQLRADGDLRYDAILINVGGNDILRRTPFHTLPAQIDRLIREARQRSDCVICTTTPNVGLVPAFFPPVSWWLTRRSRQLRDLFAAAAERHGAHYVNFFHPRSTDPFSREWQRYFAADRLHPSAECYRYVYRRLRESTPLVEALMRST
jgi:lysophospholipase L1-like esterase